jgi:uncharacterized membrane protein
MLTIRNGVSLATSAALVAFAAAAPTTPVLAKSAGASMVHCYGVNTCKGTSDCKTAKNDCKGQNSCKGQGFKELTAKQCKAESGSLTAPN